MSDKPLQLTVTIALKRGYDTVASNTLTASAETDARLVGMHVEKTVDSLRSDAETFATTTDPVSETVVNVAD